MFVTNQIIDDEVIYIAVCDICELPFKEDVTHSYHIHQACYWGLEIHAPENKETLKTLGFKEYSNSCRLSINLLFYLY